MRDYLNAHRDKAEQYSELKIKLAKEYPEDRIAYTEEKSKFIENILNEASDWYATEEAKVIIKFANEKK